MRRGRPARGQGGFSRESIRPAGGSLCPQNSVSLRYDQGPGAGSRAVLSGMETRGHAPGPRPTRRPTPRHRPVPASAPRSRAEAGLRRGGGRRDHSGGGGPGDGIRARGVGAGRLAPGLGVPLTPWQVSGGPGDVGGALAPCAGRPRGSGSRHPGGAHPRSPASWGPFRGGREPPPRSRGSKANLPGLAGRRACGAPALVSTFPNFPGAPASGVRSGARARPHGRRALDAFGVQRSGPARS